MKHVIMGVVEGADFASFEKDVPASIDELKPVMGWVNDDDHIYDYRLTPKQVNAIEQLCGFKLPAGLEFFLTCNA